MYNHIRWTKTFNYHVNLVKYEQSPSLGTHIDYFLELVKFYSNVLSHLLV